MMRSSASFYQTAIQNETNFLVFHLCDNAGTPIEPLDFDGSSFKFQFRYVNHTAIALELAAVEVKIMACMNNSVYVSAVFPYSGDLVLYVDLFDEGLAPTSINIRCLSSSISHLLSMSSFEEAHAILAKSEMKSYLDGLSVSFLESSECRQCLKIYLLFREVHSALVQISQGNLIVSGSYSPASFLILLSTGQHISISGVFDSFVSEVHCLLKLDKSEALNTSETAVGSFFDTLQGWALNFVQFTVEPIMEELRRPNSSHKPDVSVIEPSNTDRCVQENPARVEMKHQKANFSNAHDINFQLKKAQRQPSQAKMLADAAFILSNVSSVMYHMALLWRLIFIVVGSACHLGRSSCVVVCYWL
jgi:hypothetical protein